jgi:hypothetical protein
MADQSMAVSDDTEICCFALFASELARLELFLTNFAGTG